MEFEYTVTSIFAFCLMEVRKILDKFGVDGWELVHADWANSLIGKVDGQIGGVFTFKRQRHIHPLEKTMMHLRSLREICNAEEPPCEPQSIRPLFIDNVAVCTGSSCEQFDIVGYKCKLAGAVDHVTACPVWYKREGKSAPPGVAQFIHDRESLCPDPENNWEPLVKKIEEAMDDFAHYESHSTRTEARRAAVEIVLRAVENAGFRVIGKGGNP